MGSKMWVATTLVVALVGVGRPVSAAAASSPRVSGASTVTSSDVVSLGQPPNNGGGNGNGNNGNGNGNTGSNNGSGGNAGGGKPPEPPGQTKDKSPKKP